MTAEDLLPLDDVARDHHVATFDEEHGPTVFGGLLLGCTTRAACRSVEDSPLASLHMYFLRAVPARASVDFRVERVRDGRRVSHRRVEVSVGDRVCCQLVACFANDADGPDLCEHDPVASAPGPDALPSHTEVAVAEGWEYDGADDPVEWRWVGRPYAPAPSGEPSRYRAWVKPRRAIGPEPGLHTGLIAYLSDYHSHWPVARMRGGGVHFEAQGFTSLDTAIWFHRPPTWNDWWLIESECIAGQAGRALSRRRLYDRAGRPVATMAQEALIG